MIRLRDGALSKVCRDMNLSREGLSGRMGVSASTLYRIDRGDSIPSNRIIALLLQVTNANFDALFEVLTEGPPSATDVVSEPRSSDE